jgi:glycine betaine/proline transport system ATP-binding protein
MGKVQLEHSWKIFGPNPQHVLTTMDQAASRQEVCQRTGHNIGVCDVSL